MFERRLRLRRVAEANKAVSDPPPRALLPPPFSHHHANHRLVDPGATRDGGVHQGFHSPRVRVLAVHTADPQLAVARLVWPRRLAILPFLFSSLGSILFNRLRGGLEVRRVERRRRELARLDERGGGGEAAVGRAPRAALRVLVVVVAEELVARGKGVGAHLARESRVVLGRFLFWVGAAAIRLVVVVVVRGLEAAVAGVLVASALVTHAELLRDGRLLLPVHDATRGYVAHFQ